VQPNLQQNITKVTIGTDTLKQLALETTNIRHLQDKRSHIVTHGSQMDGYINVSTGIYCELFSYYMPLGQHSTTCDGEIEAVRTALWLLNLQQDEFERAVIFSDLKASLLSAGDQEKL
jgi:hypothetical protein